MQYRVRLFDSSAAAIREQLIVAPSKEAASQGFEASGLVVLSVQVAARPRWAPVLDHAASLDVPWWCKELRTLLAAGMTVVEALETLNEEAVGSARARVHATVVGCLREGQPLSAAMQAAAVFPGVLVAGVKASERTSALVDALDDYLRYHEMLDRLRKQIVSAAIYPAVVVALGGMITLFLLLFVIPRFSGMYADLRGPVSWTTAWLVTTSRLLNAHWNVVAGGFASVLALLIGAWKSGAVSSAIVALGEAITPLQRQLDEFRLAKLYHSLALMFRGGYALDAALQQCAMLGLGARVQQAVAGAQRALACGQRVSTAFSDAGLTDTVTRRLLAVGERTGNFERVLQTIAERHASRFTTFIERATRVVEPLLLLVVALVVGGIVVMMYMPVFDVATSLH